HLERMHKLAQRLRARREQRGALEFAIEQAQVVLDDDDPRRVRDVRRSKQSEEIRVAYGIVEDFMMAANEAIAHFFGVRKLDTVWRIHDRPDEARIEVFARLAAAYGITLVPGEAGGARTLGP